MKSVSVNISLKLFRPNWRKIIYKYSENWTKYDLIWCKQSVRSPAVNLVVTGYQFQQREKKLNNDYSLHSTDWPFYKQLNFCNLGGHEAAERSEQLIYWSSRQLDQGCITHPNPPDDGWSAAGNERLYQGALSPSSRSRQARFLSNCIGFSNFLFQDEWIEILRWGEGLLIVCNPGVIITYDPFSIFVPTRAGYYSQSTAASSPKTLWICGKS